MSPETPMNPREEIEMRLTALLMGELPPEEATALKAQMAADPRLAVLHARLKKAMELLREASAIPEQSAPPTPVQLSSERRERLLAHFKSTPPPPASAPVIKMPRRDWSWIAQMGLAAGLIAFLGGSVLTSIFSLKQDKKRFAEPPDFAAESSLVTADTQVGGNFPAAAAPGWGEGGANERGRESFSLNVPPLPNAPTSESPAALAAITRANVNAAIKSGAGTLILSEGATAPVPPPSPQPAATPAPQMSFADSLRRRGAVPAPATPSSSTALATDGEKNEETAKAKGQNRQVPVLGDIPLLGSAFDKPASPPQWSGSLGNLSDAKPSAEQPAALALGGNRLADAQQNPMRSFNSDTDSFVPGGTKTYTGGTSIAAGTTTISGVQSGATITDSSGLTLNGGSLAITSEKPSRPLMGSETLTFGQEQAGGSLAAPAAANITGNTRNRDEVIRNEEAKKNASGRREDKAGIESGTAGVPMSPAIPAQPPASAPADSLGRLENKSMAEASKVEEPMGRTRRLPQRIAPSEKNAPANKAVAQQAQQIDARRSAMDQKQDQLSVDDNGKPAQNAGQLFNSVDELAAANPAQRQAGKEMSGKAAPAVDGPVVRSPVSRGAVLEDQGVVASPDAPAAKPNAPGAKGVEVAKLDALKEELSEAREELKQLEKEREVVRPQQPAAVPQPEVATSANAFSTFSLHVSDVAFKLAAASLEQGRMPELVTVRSEEFINAFDYRDPEPAAGAPLAFASERARYPFAQNRDLLRLSVKTAAAGRQPGRALNLVLLLDNSGSMERADRVRILREALRVLGTQLQPQDKLSVVTFARTPRLWADGVAGDKAGEVTARVGEITPQGGTNLAAALDLGYATALRHYQVGSINRVVLITDGAANLGDVTPDALKQKVEAHRKQGVALDCFGIGWEGLDDTLLEALSRNGDGRYGFINSPEEAATEFAGQLAGALRVAASDVKVQVEFNPRRVTAYRQVGYAKHQLTKEQFRDNTVDAAEIGAAESGNALYVVEVNPRGAGDLATVRVRFKVPGTSDYKEHAWTVPFTREAPPLEQASPALRLAGSASAFSEWLVASPFAAEVSPDRLLGLLNGVPAIYGADPRPKKLEWMIRTAKSVSGR